MIPVCPKCDVQLFIIEFKGIELDFCYQCRGVWLDRGELEDLLIRGGAKADDALLTALGQKGRLISGRKNLCPKCDSPLHEILIECEGKSQLTLDRCPREHGIWFDAHELEDLLERFPPQCNAGQVIEYLHEIFGASREMNTEENA